MNGILVIDKPAGLSSFDVVRRVRRLTATRRVGHAGTLDPMATGVLPVAVGQATRILEYLMGGTKEYLASLRLGITTDTQDAEGQVLETRPWDQVTAERLAECIRGFTGEIRQVPPMYSALKRDGVPLYRLARQGVEVEREARCVTIERISVERYAPPEIALHVTCSKGTYIRTLAHDLGEALGCGAHLTALRRVRNGLFTTDSSWTIEQLEAQAERGDSLPLLDPAAALADWPGLHLSGAPLARLYNGRAPLPEEVEGTVPAAGERVRLMDGGVVAALGRVIVDELGAGPDRIEIMKVFPRVS